MLVQDEWHFCQVVLCESSLLQYKFHVSLRFSSNLHCRQLRPRESVIDSSPVALDYILEI